MTAPSGALASVQNRVAEIQMLMGGTARGGAGGVLGNNAAFQDALTSALSNGESTNGASGHSPSSITGASAVDEAKKYLGVPYAWGGADASGLDCSGLLQLAYKNLGVALPRVAADQARAGSPVASLAQAKPGDLVAFGRPVDHIGMYVGDNKMIIAPKRGDVVKIQEIYETPVAIRRIVPESGAASIGAMSTRAVVGTGPLASPYTALFNTAGAKHGISPQLLMAVAKTESNFNPNAKSPAGAQGLMQFMPATAKGLGVNPLDPASAVDGAARMLSGLVKKFGSTDFALAAYNAGPGAVQKYGGIPPYKETQNYVKKINALLNQGVQ